MFKRFAGCGYFCSLVFTLSWVAATSLACDGVERKSIAEQIGPPSKKFSDLKQDSEVSDEEIARRRKEAGFKSKAEIDAELAAENAKQLETLDREWIKARIKEYRTFTTRATKFVDDLEKEAGEWAVAKDSQKAFGKSVKGLEERLKALIQAQDKLSERSTKGGNTQASYNKVFRSLEEVTNSLGPGIANNPAFIEVIKNTRAELDLITQSLDEIDKDETLTSNKVPGGDSKDTAR
ncbi:hypothetical protein OV203_38520 [Nannocystis sp. ILAH1]|uniref:hypothetical protein n=1 Tax=Nannocystis sp. ILAH1 TaxID=2996789 RepID=UPI00226F4EFB|nr:hypothetical protein [Nannocystis sp. ILAH1]MCY0993099.1 hypothetical protein [Nannocystis sp. ILAH1]